MGEGGEAGYNSPLNALSSTDGTSANNSSPVADCNSRSMLAIAIVFLIQCSYATI